MSDKKEFLLQIEEDGATNGWVAPLNQDDRDYFAHFRSVCNRYNIQPSRAPKLEYDFETRVTESEFYLRQANA